MVEFKATESLTCYGAYSYSTLIAFGDSLKSSVASIVLCKLVMLLNCGGFAAFKEP